jgi:hypothetical protein
MWLLRNPRAAAADFGLSSPASRRQRTPREPDGPSRDAPHEPRRCRALRQCASRRVLLRLVVATLAVALVLRCSAAVVDAFRWAEAHVRRDSPAHMAAFLLVSLPFHLGLPIPVVHQAWAVAIGCFFGWSALPILFASLSVGVPLPFLIGRRLAAYHGDVEATDARLRQIAPRAVAYFAPLRRTIAKRPVYASFLLMWSPLPTSSIPLLMGFLVPRSCLRKRDFVAGALPSKLLHFSCDVLIGIEVGSLAAALDAHDGADGRHPHARAIAFGAMGMTGAFMGLMLYTMHQSLKGMHAQDRDAHRNDDNV